MHTRILILEDNNALRSSLETFLNGIKKYVVVENFENGAHDTATPTPTILETTLMISKCRSSKEGNDAFRGIRKMKAETAFIMYTVFDNDQNQFDFLQAGTKESFLNNIDFEHLLGIIKNTDHKAAPKSPSLDTTCAPSLILRKNYKLSPREKEVLKCLVNGYSYRMIAGAIFVSLSTVQAHVKNIYAKLHVNSGTQAVAIAIREHIV